VTGETKLIFNLLGLGPPNQLAIRISSNQKQLKYVYQYNCRQVLVTL